MISHVIRVRKQRVTVDDPRLIRGCKGSDEILLDLDDEWTGLDHILVSIGTGDDRREALWDGEPMTLDVDFPAGYLPVSVSGSSPDGSRRLETLGAPHAFVVVNNGRSGR